MRGDRGQITGLAEAIEALRSQLIEAIGKGVDQPMRFTLEPIELTLQAVVTTGGDGKIGWGSSGSAPNAGQRRPRPSSSASVQCGGPRTAYTRPTSRSRARSILRPISVPLEASDPS